MKHILGFTDKPPLDLALELLYEIQAALGTTETGHALVEVARNAHKAEQEFTMLERRYPGFQTILKEEYEP